MRPDSAILLRHIRGLVPAVETEPHDRELLRRFTATRDNAAFAMLLQRHGPLVWDVCLRLLGHDQDAEDAFQATFLILARRAASIRKQDGIASWLYGVAQHVARDLRKSAQRRRVREQRTPPRCPNSIASATALGELQTILHEEIGRLPDNYRAAFVLCFLEGLNRPEAARALGWKEGTLSSRLARARALLRQRLRRRGVDLSAGLGVASLVHSGAPPALMETTAQVGAGLSVASATVENLAASVCRVTSLAILLVKVSAFLAVLVAAAMGWTRLGKGLMAPATFPAAGAANPKAAEARDRHGDPLPQGAIARFGTTRLRALSASIRFSTDGKTLVGVDNGRVIRVWDAATGKLQERRLLPGRPERDPWSVQMTRSPDGNTLLLCEGSTLELWDIPGGKRLDLPLPKDRKRLNCFAFTDDRRWLALVETVSEKWAPGGGGFGTLEQEQNLLLWDTKNRQMQTLAEKQSGLVAVAISPDGRRVVSSGSSFSPKGFIGTRLWDATTGKMLWQHAGFNAEKVLLTPDGKYLFGAPGGGQHTWHIWETATGAATADLCPPDVGCAWNFTLSPDGTRLLIPTRTEYVLWDLKAGKVLRRWPGAELAGQVLFAPDGRSVLTYKTTLQRWDLASGQPLYGDVGALGHTDRVAASLISPDGRHVVSRGEDRTIRIWKLCDARLLHTLESPSKEIDAWIFTPDGKVLLVVDQGLRVHRWSVADGRRLQGYELTEAKKRDIGLRVQRLAFLADGTTLAATACPRCPEYSFLKYSFVFWEADSGKRLRWGGDPGRDYPPERRPALSPDGRLTAAFDDLYDTTTGERWGIIGPKKNKISGGDRTVFSPDSRLAAHDDGIWEVASGTCVCRLPGVYLADAAFAPDGRWFVAAKQVGRDWLTVYDLATGKALLERPALELAAGSSHGWLDGIAFAPDGRTLVTGHPDGTLLAWACPSRAKFGKALTPRDAAVCWQELLDANAARAYAAIWRFADEPEIAVKFLREHLKPCARPTDTAVGKLLRDLDSDQFEIRESASRQWEALGRGVEPILRQALKEPRSVEQKRRIEELLSSLESFLRPHGDDLRAVRSVAILEAVATAAARTLVEEWAKGLPGARLTEEAKEARQRMVWRSNK